MTDKVFVDGAEQINDSAEILNWYRNLYHTENSNTEKGIMARAINDILPEYCRQRAEIERLKGIAEVKQKNKRTLKAKAIKEFAERVKERTYHYYDSDIDEVAKELTDSYSS